MTNESQIFTKNQQFLSPHFLKLHLTSFTQALTAQGFTTLTIQSYIASIAHFGTWLRTNHITLGRINHEVLSDFAKHHCSCPGGRKRPSVSRKYVKRVQRFLIFLSQQSVIYFEPDSTGKIVPTLVLQFREHLRLRGLSISTIARYEYAISKLLPLLGDEPKKYDANTIRRAIAISARQHSLAGTKSQTTALRAYLRFLIIERLCHADLDCAVPTVALWSLSSMPRYITAQEVERVIDACNTDTDRGLRDRAILLFLSQLGLRAGDIVNMELDDIDWDAGTLRVKGKGHREDLLPLPQSVGDAVLAYLGKARPAVSITRIFLCLNAPYRPFSSSPTVSAIVDAALFRAGISNPPSRGAHLLRHSAATNMLRAGATLETVSSMLRHRSLDMTAYYAKVDIPQLRQIAQTWPEDASC